ncbi:MAG: energy-coupling factor transporter ATPase [Tenericutes bacterium GWC2_34_14]|nr:MAG: energy-coupling factor transporter ATPase [Tenericutes bacterium GWA2_35_7]OHE29025.1 MAG: energy-coupling factor transporter ATPase [Tenericutes bacterium GWC2_34_14]OHE33978.1 MAG: energy-coupling factor transporter ATPase [Tenericutes bacterium GWE2_34_108]OHE35311.1 MAG: energy-coupling factor transporter ATPase [Tenericutes bacterium GWF1_35_14]OHE38344.1 MAG: energy-coupling factor transporter ATPase [Tenericutes bacterium GWF2_35_184]OHE42679.1 MAG: energy-coupling factor transp
MIKVSDLSFSYNQEDEALKKINLSVEKGSWVSILGHNGSGKSTLSKCLVGLLAPTSGEIFIDGQQLDEKNLPHIRKKIGIVFQNPDNQFVGVTVKHDIAFGLENQCLPHDEMMERINHYAKLVGMEDFLNKEPHHLSGGQKQRVAIAGALAMEQDILILDEATSMLDPEGTREIVELIKYLNKTLNKTIITITHDLSFAGLSDRLIVLKDGEVILEGTPRDVFKHEELLKSSHLELPFGLALYNDLAKDPKTDPKLLEALWAFNSKM